VAGVLYLAVAVAGRLLAGPRWGAESNLYQAGMPFVRAAGIAAMAGVVLNLILGLSRVWLAMGRRGEMPSALARVDTRHQPRVAIVTTGVLVAAVSLVGDIGLAWSFSAMTVLLYYAVTNLAAIRAFPGRWSAWAGLVSCLGLSFFVPWRVWVVGAGLVTLGIVTKTVSRARPRVPSPPH
jgi:APA family basic amino acid/polyamine antiporter